MTNVRVLLFSVLAYIALVGCGDDTVTTVNQPSVETETTIIKEVPVLYAPIQVGVRPHYLVNDMEDSPLKKQLQQCENGPFKTSDFSIGHRGAALQFPEHSKESYLAAIKQGAGIVECDVAFTKDMELVCRHAQNDLHTTTNILVTSLAEKCTKPFVPAVLDANGKVITPASAECRTSDITLAEFKTLKAKMDDANPAATTAEAYQKSTNTYRTDLYASNGTVMTHKESIALINGYNRKFTPELKAPVVSMPYTFNGVTMTQDDLATKMIQDYIDAGIDPSRVYAQSFQPRDIYFWIEKFPVFGKQAVYLDDYSKSLSGLESGETFADIYRKGVRYIGPALPKILTLDANKNMIASEYTQSAKSAGLNLIAWTVERNVPLYGGNGWYYQSIKDAVQRDGDAFTIIDALYKQAGVKGIFSDWPATTTYYANCMGLN